MLISSPNSNKWLNIGFGEEITQVELIEVTFIHLIWSFVHYEKQELGHST